jgi:hypothetical protein
MFLLIYENGDRMLDLFELMPEKDVANKLETFTEKQREEKQREVLGILEKHSPTDTQKDTMKVLVMILHMRSFEIGKDTHFKKRMMDVLNSDELMVVEDKVKENNRIIKEMHYEFMKIIENLNLKYEELIDIKSLLLTILIHSFNEGYISVIVNEKWPPNHDNFIRPGGW